MQLIANGTQVASLPAPAAPTGTPGWINNAPPGAGVTPTGIDPDVNNALIAEVANLVEGPGITLAPGTFTQALAAVKRLAGANITTVSAAGTTTLTADNAGLVLVNATAGSIAIDLPAVASANGVPFGMTFVRTDATGNTVTFVANGSDTFLSIAWGAIAAPALFQGAPVELLGDGALHWLEMPPLARGSQLFLSASTFTVPSGITLLWLSGTASGAGGGGAYSASSIVNAGGGGSSGESVFRSSLVVTPGQTFPVSMGAAGTGGAGSTSGGVSSGTGGNGGALSFGGALTLSGGRGGGNSGSSNPGGGGASVGTGSVAGGQGAGVDITSATTMPGGRGGPSAFGSYGAGGDGGLGTNGPAAAAGSPGGPPMLLVEW
ncbi:MAG: hypothetical protein HIU82_02090 [Proteobacteria bacterium]|nr:hypothetical protein [Pseudomonadota bacterium]